MRGRELGGGDGGGFQELGAHVGDVAVVLGCVCLCERGCGYRLLCVNPPSLDRSIHTLHETKCACICMRVKRTGYCGRRRRRGGGPGGRRRRGRPAALESACMYVDVGEVIESVCVDVCRCGGFWRRARLVFEAAKGVLSPAQRTDRDRTETIAYPRPPPAPPPCAQWPSGAARGSAASRCVVVVCVCVGGVISVYAQEVQRGRVRSSVCRHVCTCPCLRDVCLCFCKEV